MKSFTRLLSALAMCALTIIGYGFWYAAIEAKSAAVAEIKNEITAKNASAGQIASARASLAELSGSEEVIQGYFVPETGVVAFINNLEARGRKQGATVSVRSVSADTAETLPMLSFALTITGSFDAVMRTVGVIEYSPYKLSVSSLSITYDNKNSWSADLAIRVGSAPTSPATATKP